MNWYLRKILHKALPIAGVMFAFSMGSAYSKAISEQPLYETRYPDPNLIFVIDDSSSMHAEVMMEVTDGRPAWSLNQARFTAPGTNNLAFAWPSFRYPFGAIYPLGRYRNRDNIRYDAYDGRILEQPRFNGRIPPLNIYGFFRSPHYNSAYYQPGKIYKPWASFGDYDQTFENVDPMAAPLAPVQWPGREQVTVDLTRTWTWDYMESLRKAYREPELNTWMYTLPEGMPCDDNGTRNIRQCQRDGNGRRAWQVRREDIYGDRWNILYRHYNVRPAHYFRVVTAEDNVTFFINRRQARVCGTAEENTAGIDNLYNSYIRNPRQFFPDRAQRERYAFGPDGLCLEKVEITDPDELQNFANWFTYYRRRHHAFRGAVGHGFATATNDMNIRMLAINRLIRGENVFLDVGKFSENKGTFLENIYNRSVNGGGTPLRRGLQAAGEIYRSNQGNFIQHYCQKNYAFLFTDGFNSDRQTGNNSDASAVAPFRNQNSSGTLADLAYDYYHNLNPRGFRRNTDPGLVPGQAGSDCSALGINGSENVLELRRKLDQSIEDCNPQLHMSTFTMAINATGEIFNNEDFYDDGTVMTRVQDAFDMKDNPAFVWPSVDTPQSPSQIDDLYHAAVNGRGEIFNAARPDEIQQKVEELIQRIGGVEAVTQTGFAINDDKDTLYQGQFSTSAMVGDLVAFPLAASGAIQAQEGRKWSAAQLLNERVETEEGRDSRRIVTKAGSEGVLFEFDNLTDDQKKDLVSPELVDYFRGNREVPDLRKRTSVLGEFANAKIQYVGKPKENWPNQAPFGEARNRYRRYVAQKRSRMGVVYGAANDGMLHGFDASTGEEVLAYVPGLLFAEGEDQGLSDFSRTNYQRRSYVDLSITVADAFVSVGTDDRRWRTLLVGGFRTGGRGLYALDVSNPLTTSQYAALTDEEKAQLASDTLVWEADSEEFDTFVGKPQIALLNNNQWSVVIAGGYKNAATTGIDAGGNVAEAFGKLHIVNLETNDKSDPEIITLTTPERGGLSEASLLDTDGNGTVDRVYAGDLLGNVWRFNLSSDNSAMWDVKKVYDGNQPITAGIALRFDNYSGATVSGARPVLLSFGTGSFLSLGDIDVKDQQSLIIVKDDDSPDAKRFRDLQLLNADNAMPGQSFAIASTPGFRYDLKNEVGERVFVKAVAFKDEMIFSSSTPINQICLASGNSYIHRLKITNGGISPGGITTIPRLGELIMGLTITAAKDGTILLNEETANPLTSDPESILQTVLGQLQVKEGRLSWEELVDE